MRRVFAVMVGLILAAGLLVGSAAAQPDDDILITGVWARATAAMPVAEATPEMGMKTMPEATAESGMSMGSVSAAYMTIENAGSSAVRLVGASTAAAGLAEIHEVMMENDVMRMRPLERGLDIPAASSVELRPGGYHVMLMELTRELVPGQAISLTLMFEVLDASGTASGTRREVIVGAPIRADTEMPDKGEFVFIRPWARPTTAAMNAEAAPEMGGMMADATAEATTAMGGVSAAYMQILNRGPQPDRLVGAATTAAMVVEIHEVTMENDVMRMRPLEGGIELPVGELVNLKPGGYHIMLMELTQEFVPGEAIALTLQFESGAEIEIGVPIYDGMAME